MGNAVKHRESAVWGPSPRQGEQESGSLEAGAEMSAAKRFIPLLDRVLVEKVKRDAKTAAGILLPDTASKMNEGVSSPSDRGAWLRTGRPFRPSSRRVTRCCFRSSGARPSSSMG